MPKGKEIPVDLTPTVAALAKWIGDAVTEGIARALLDMPRKGPSSEQSPSDPFHEEREDERVDDSGS